MIIFPSQVLTSTKLDQASYLVTFTALGTDTCHSVIISSHDMCKLNRGHNVKTHVLTHPIPDMVNPLRQARRSNTTSYDQLDGYVDVVVGRKNYYGTPVADVMASIGNMMLSRN